MFGVLMSSFSGLGTPNNKPIKQQQQQQQLLIQRQGAVSGGSLAVCVLQ
jgi:hypothetical protein